MKYFEPTNSEWSDKINFVDEHNVFVGYDFSSCCCEHFGWFITQGTEKILDDKSEANKINELLAPFVFDKKFFETSGNADQYDEGGEARFRLVNGDQELFLTLFNSQNGYYGHGFEFLENGEILHRGCL
jgi:threonyl-tRNA synthetase